MNADGFGSCVPGVPISSQIYRKLEAEPEDEASSGGGGFGTGRGGAFQSPASSFVDPGISLNGIMSALLQPGANVEEGGRRARPGLSH